MKSVDQTSVNEAFSYLKSLVSNREDRQKILSQIGVECAVKNFRSTEDPFVIPILWSLSKQALTSLLGITSYEGYETITGIQLYAGLNENSELTLIAVSTTGTNRSANDITVDDQYPYFDYADSCPNYCDTKGTLKITNPVLHNFSRIKSNID